MDKHIVELIKTRCGSEALSKFLLSADPRRPPPVPLQPAPSPRPTRYRAVPSPWEHLRAHTPVTTLALQETAPESIFTRLFRPESTYDFHKRNYEISKELAAYYDAHVLQGDRETKTIDHLVLIASNSGNLRPTAFLRIVEELQDSGLKGVFKTFYHDNEEQLKYLSKDVRNKPNKSLLDNIENLVKNHRVREVREEASRTFTAWRITCQYFDHPLDARSNEFFENKNNAYARFVALGGLFGFFVWCLRSQANSNSNS